MASFKLIGMKEIHKAFKDLEPKVAKKVVRKALRKGMKIVLAEAKVKAPTGETKQLKKSLKIKARKRSRKVIAMDLTSGKGDFKGDQYYAAMVEYGTKKQPAQHYMRDAFEAKGGVAAKAIKDAIRDGILEQAQAKK